MSQKRILIFILLLMVLNGFIDATFTSHHGSQPLAWSLPLGLCLNFLTFLWYRRNSDQYSYRRTRWLNISVIMFPPLAVPYYLLRSRPRGNKVRALLKCVGFAVLMLLASVVGWIASGHPLGGA